jgi:hypothetical protein
MPNFQLQVFARFPNILYLCFRKQLKRVNYCKTAQSVGDFLVISLLFKMYILQKYSHLNG